MKRLLAILVFLLAAVGMAKAQDVYVSGTGYNEFGNMTAVVYRNSDLLYTQSSDNMDQLGYGVVVNPNNHNDLFWLVIEDDNQGWAASTIYRNDQQYNSLGEGSYAFRLNWCDLGTDDPNQSLFISGYRIVDGGLYAAIWRGDDPTPLYSPNCGDGRQSMALGVVGVPGPSGTVDLYYGGNREDESNLETATVWKNNEVLYTFDASGVSSIVVSLDYYDGVLYSLVNESWSGGGALRLYANNQLESILIEDTAENYTASVKVDGGYVYVYAYYDQGETKVWRDGELVYSHQGTFGELYDTFCLDVTSDGVYYAALDYDMNLQQGQFYVYQNEGVVQAFDITEMTQITCIDVVMKCESEDARELPYSESFEMGATDWECWTLDDEGENNGEQGDYKASYWHRSCGRSSIHPVTGDYLAYHGWNDGVTQEGWLVSPRLSIPSGTVCTLTFQTYELYYNEMEYEGVWVSTTGNDPGSFTEVWSQTNPYDDWRMVEVDLSAYHGQEVCIAFKYAGFDGHSWFIDDVNVEAVVAVYTVTVNANPYEGGTVTGGGSYQYGDLATLTATPAYEYVFVRWDDGNTDNPRVVTVTGDATYIAVFESHVGVGEQEQHAVRVCPNPAKESIRIEGLEGNSEVRIYNSLGELVKVVNATADQEIGIEDLSGGLYLVRCGNQTQRFVKN